MPPPVFCVLAEVGRRHDGHIDPAHPIANFDAHGVVGRMALAQGATPYFDMSCDCYLAPTLTNMRTYRMLHLGLEKTIFGYMRVCSVERTLTKKVGCFGRKII